MYKTHGGIFTNARTNKEWISGTLIINGERFSTVGIRIKGNSSLSSAGRGDFENEWQPAENGLPGGRQRSPGGEGFEIPEGEDFAAPEGEGFGAPGGGMGQGGDGIEKSDLPYIWERYYKGGKTHKRAIAGTGLGLSIVREIFKLHNARYGVYSEPGCGSTFWFELPL